MISDKERTLEKAAKLLSEKAGRQRGEMLQIFKGFRKIEEHRLRMWHYSGGGGREVVRQRSDLVDILFRELFENISRAVAPKGLAEPLVVAAFGGYGRRELTPFSDVDIMFLHEQPTPSTEVEEVIRQTLVALWDIGFKVGHSTRTVQQALKHANTDMITRTSMLECRYLSGQRELFTQFKQKFDVACVDGCEEVCIAWRLGNQAEMWTKYGGTVFMQEPNVKFGMGGLREYHNLLWLSYFKHRITTTSRLVEAKFLRDSGRRLIEKGYDFLLRVRSEMQYLTGRASDSLTLQLQGRVANSFRYPQRNILRRCEEFMRDYYRHTRDIHLVAQSAIERMQISRNKKEPGMFSLFTPKVKIEKFDGFIARDGVLTVETREIFNEDPYRMIRAFHHAQIRQLVFHAELNDLIRRRLHLVNRTFQYAVSTRETFFAILSRKGEVGKVLRSMHNLGFLGRYIPEFGALTCLVQHEFYHRYTADEHTLVCIEKLDGILFSEEERFRGYRALFQKFEDPAVLYLSLLLHDTGKAANQRHHEEASTVLAHKVARRLQLSSERRRMLITLVDSHYTLSHSSQTRNLDDPATVTEFARIVGNRGNLEALMLITLVDGMGTSDQNWSDWKEALVWTLFRRTADYLEGGTAATENRRKDLDALREAMTKKLSKDFAEEIEAHFQYMPDRYFQMFDAEDVAGHLRLFREFYELQYRDDVKPWAPAFRWVPRADQGHSEVWVCGWDRPRLLERIAGAFLTTQINILSADIFTRGDTLALDIFRVCNTQLQAVTNPKDFARVEARLGEALAGEDYDFSPLMGKETRMRAYRISQEIEYPASIVLDDVSHPVYTLVDIQAADRLGLLYSLLRALGEAGVSIELSRITTEMEVAMDSFYITKDGRKVDEPALLKRIQRLLQKATAFRPSI